DAKVVANDAAERRLMRNADTFHPDFVPEPYWWEAYRPVAGELAEVPGETRVAIVGGGYAGLAAALEFAKHGIDAVVLEQGALGVGAPPSGALLQGPPRSLPAPRRQGLRRGRGRQDHR